MPDGEGISVRLLCMKCGVESTVTEDTPGCPSCGDREGIPANLDDTVTLVMTRHELRILTMWADNHARSIKRAHVTQIILDRLAQQTDTPLTLSQEIADIRAAFPGSDVKVYDADGNPKDI